MESLAVLLAHLVGDYLLQTDWMAKNKANPHPGPFPALHEAKNIPDHPDEDKRTIEPPPKIRDGAGFVVSPKYLAWRTSQDEIRAVRAAQDAEVFEAIDSARRNEEWLIRRDAWRTGHLACFIHCLLYTFSVWLFCSSFFPLWGYLVCFLAHWAFDRYRTAGYLMRNWTGQSNFADGVCSPWGVIVVDNTWHLLTLYWILKL